MSDSIRVRWDTRRGKRVWYFKLDPPLKPGALMDGGPFDSETEALQAALTARCADYSEGDCAGPLEWCSDDLRRCDVHADAWLASLDVARGPA